MTDSTTDAKSKRAERTPEEKEARRKAKRDERLAKLSPEEQEAKKAKRAERRAALAEGKNQ